MVYFSGTGNSQLVAVRIAEMTGDKAVSINRYMKKGEKAVFRSERPLVFVAPVYSWRLPRVVEQWIMENDLEGSRDAYFMRSMEEMPLFMRKNSAAEKGCIIAGCVRCLCRKIIWLCFPPQVNPKAGKLLKKPVRS